MPFINISRSSILVVSADFNQVLIVRSFPSIKEWATFISTYLSNISSKVVSGIRSMTCNVSGKCIQFAKVNPPFEMFLVRICPAKSYSQLKIYALICCQHFRLHGSRRCNKPLSYSWYAFFRLCPSKVLSLYVNLSRNSFALLLG